MTFLTKIIKGGPAVLEKWPSLIFWPGLKGTAGAGPSDQQLSGPPGPIPPDLHDQRMYACWSTGAAQNSPGAKCTRLALPDARPLPETGGQNLRAEFLGVWATWGPAIPATSAAVHGVF